MVHESALSACISSSCLGASVLGVGVPDFVEEGILWGGELTDVVDGEGWLRGLDLLLGLGRGAVTKGGLINFGDAVYFEVEVGGCVRELEKGEG